VLMQIDPSCAASCISIHKQASSHYSSPFLTDICQMSKINSML
jgi:hypothetical protein